MYLSRSGLSRPGIFLLVTNLLVTILKARPHGSFSTSPIKSFQHWSPLFFMPYLRADFDFSQASCSRDSPLERVNLRRAARPEALATYFSPLSAHVRHLGRALHSLATCDVTPHFQQASILPGSVQPRDIWPWPWHPKHRAVYPPHPQLTKPEAASSVRLG